MTTPTQHNFGLKVDAGANRLFASWDLATAPTSPPIAADAVLSGELIVNDETKSEAAGAPSGYRSISLDNNALRTLKGAIINNVVNGIEYSVILFVYDGAKRYMTNPVKNTPQSVPQQPEISLEGTDSAIRITINNYSPQKAVSNGFADISLYDVFFNNQIRSFAAGSTIFLDGLQNDTIYEVAVRAKNANGLSDFSGTKVATPIARPLNVDAFNATALNRAVELSWVKPTIMAPNSVYKISKKLGSGAYDAEVTVEQQTAVVPLRDILSYKYENLDNGSIYSFKIRVYNPTANRYSEEKEQTATPYGAPDAPISSVLALNGTITIRLSRPDNQNGKPVSSYILNRLQGTTETAVTSYIIDPSGIWVYTITGLANGTQYSFKAYALNNTTPDSMSVASEINATPYSKPAKVTGLLAVGSNQQVRLDWVMPATNGGSPTPLSYRVTYTYVSSPAVGTFGQPGYIAPVISTVIETTNDLFDVLTQYLVNGTSYTFNVVAYFTVNGNTYNSDPESVPCVPFKPADAPSVLVEMDGDNKLSYSWAEPNLYNLPLEKYEYKFMLSANLSPENVQWVSLNKNRVFVTNPVQNGGLLAYGQEHKLIVRAVTKNGTSFVNGVEGQNLRIPYKPPTAVLNLVVYPKEESLELFWDPPSDFGGYTTMKYKVSVDGNQDADEITSEKVLITGLDNSKLYSVSVTPVGYVGSAYQRGIAVSVSGTPYSSPLAPTNFTVVPQNTGTAVVLNWTASAALLGASESIKYVVFRDDAQIADNITQATYTDNTVQPAISYTYKVMAKQYWSAQYTGYSPFTNAKTTTTYKAPEAVKGLNASGADKSMTVNWLALTSAETNGNTGTVMYDIVVSYMVGSVKTLFTPTPVSTNAVTYTFTGLTNGTTYKVEIKAKVYNSEILAYVESAVRSVDVNVNVKPLPPTAVDFIPDNGKITVKWFAPYDAAGASVDGYNFVRYDFYVNDDVTPVATSTSNVFSGTKNSIDILLTNGNSYVVKIVRVASINSVTYSSDPVTSPSLMPFGTPTIVTAVVDANKQKINFTIQPNGAKLTNIACLVVTDKYTAGDESFKQAIPVSTATSGSVSESVSFALATGTSITRFLAIVVNAQGKMAVYPTQ
jgi:hypothetical protein